MCKKYQYKILKKFLDIIFFFVKVFGLWIYKFDDRNRTIKYSFVRIIYSMSFYAFMLCGYLAVGREFVFSANRKLFVSFTFRLIFILHTSIIIISSFSLYTTHYLQYGKRKFAYEKCKEVIDLVKLYQLKFADIRKYLVLFVTKTVLVDIFTFGAIWSNWRLLGSGNSTSQFFLLAFTFLPILIVRFYTNLFYGGTLIIEATFKQFNKNLNDVVLEAKLFHPKNIEKNKFFNLRKYSELSEEIEKISILHYKLIEATKAFNSVFSFQIVLSIISLFLVLVLRCFYEYVAIVEIITTKRTAALYRCIIIFSAISFSSYDLYSTSDACESLENQANKAATILHSVEINSNLDIRFQRSVETFSSQMLLQKLKLNQSGLFDLNLNTFQSVVTSIVSYSIILIQFELASYQD